MENTVVVNFTAKVGNSKYDEQVEIVIPEDEDEDEVIEEFFTDWVERNVLAVWERALW